MFESKVSLVTRLAWGISVGALVAVMYRWIQELTLSQSVAQPPCWSWDYLPFSPYWVLPYFSVFLLMGLPWFFLPSLAQVRRFGLAILVAEGLAWTCFLFYPTTCPRLSAEGQPLIYQWLLQLDQPNNCMPCLHVLLTVAGAWALGRSAPFFSDLRGRMILFVWGLLILLSVLGLRQHTVIDMAGGLLLSVIFIGVYETAPMLRLRSALSTNYKNGS